MARIYKKDVNFLITQLDIPTLSEISQFSRYTNFQRGSKTALRKALRQANTQQEVRQIWNYATNLYETQQLGFTGLVNRYLERSDTSSFRKAFYYANKQGLDDRQILRFFETYEGSLLATEDSGDIQKMIEEFVLNDDIEVEENDEF